MTKAVSADPSGADYNLGLTFGKACPLQIRLEGMQFERGQEVSQAHDGDEPSEIVSDEPAKTIPLVSASCVDIWYWSPLLHVS